MNWELIWKIVLIFTLAAYSLLVIIVSIGGVGNIIEMLRDLREPVDIPEDQSE
jgi:hypothetical protein